MGCGAVKASAELVRLVRGGDGTLAIGRTLPGRGAWICPDERCIRQAARRRALPRALHGPVRLDEAVISRIVSALAG